MSGLSPPEVRMARPLVTDDLWQIIEPLLPPPRPRRRDRRRRGGMTCWRRLRDWHEAGVWRELHRVLLDKLNAADKIDWSRAVVDSASVRALHGGKKQAQIRSIG